MADEELKAAVERMEARTRHENGCQECADMRTILAALREVLED